MAIGYASLALLPLALLAIHPLQMVLGLAIAQSPLLWVAIPPQDVS
jgi:hypothetical protein